MLYILNIVAAIYILFSVTDGWQLYCLIGLFALLFFFKSNWNLYMGKCKQCEIKPSFFIFMIFYCLDIAFWPVSVPIIIDSMDIKEDGSND